MIGQKIIGCKKYKNRTGILIAQLGTPDAPTPGALRPYLKQFLSDPRVIETNRFLWWIILRLFVLTKRPKRSAALYARIWTEQGSPLLVITKRQTELLDAALRKEGLDIEVTFGMRYGANSLEEAIDRLIEKGCSRILLFPMYPHYSATTTASIYDVVLPHLLKRRWIPTLRIVDPYYRNSEFIKALGETITSSVGRDHNYEKLVLSYHGIPQKYVVKGDPYCCMCNETTAALLPHLPFKSDAVIHTFQSRFGRDPWLQPYTDETIEDLAKQGVKKIAVACPGFTTDCLETLDELGNEGSELFHEHGGEELKLIPCLNDQEPWIKAMTSIAKSELGSWINPEEDENVNIINCSWQKKAVS